MRSPYWPEQLSAQIEAARDARFVWGEHDCFMWAARVVKALGGADLAAGIRGTYDDEAGASAVILSLGPDLASAVGVLCAEAGMQEIPPGFAQRGDLLILEPRIPQLTAQTTAICVGRDAAVPGLRGLLFLPASLAMRAWAV